MGRTGTRWSWLCALALCACVRAGSGGPPGPSATPPAPVPLLLEPVVVEPEPVPLEALLPPLPGGVPPAATLVELQQRVAHLLAADRPQDAAPLPDGSADARARVKIEAYFEARRRWEDGHLLEVTEVLGALMDGLSGDGPTDTLRHGLSALLLEDQVAQGFGLGPGAQLLDLPGPQALAEALARPEVDFAGLSAGAYGRCGAAAAGLPGGQAWRALCDAGARRMRLRGGALPACAASGLTRPVATFAPAATGPAAVPETTPQEGLLLHGVYDVPLLQQELSRVTAAAHQRLSRVLGRPLRLAHAPVGSPPADCQRPLRPSEALLREARDMRWYGLSLHCQDGRCGVTVCSDGPDCYRAELRGAPARLRSWLDALSHLAPAQQGPLLVESEPEAQDPAAVAFAVRALYGPWRDPDGVRATLSRSLPGLLACQGTDRFEVEWVLDVDRRGHVRGLRPASPHHPYPMDEAAVLSSAQTDCARAVLQGLALPRAIAPGARRILLSLRVPATLQVELPVTASATTGADRIVAAASLARDGGASRLTRCVASASAELRAVGICARVAPDGGVAAGQVEIDLTPLHAPRVRQVLAGTTPALSTPEPVRSCVAELLAELPFACRPDGPVRDLAMTVRLPRDLVERYQ